MIKSLIFDLGGVYLNRGLWVAQEKISTEFNLPLDKVKTSVIRTHYEAFFTGKITEEEYWTRCIKDWHITTNYQYLRSIVLDSFSPQPGMPELIIRLKVNYQLGLLSDQTREWWSVLNAKYHILDKFDFCIISTDVKLKKPNPEIYKLAINKSDYPPSEIVYIDDLEDNLPPAESLGMETIFFTNPDNLMKDLKERNIIV